MPKPSKDFPLINHQFSLQLAKGHLLMVSQFTGTAMPNAPRMLGHDAILVESANSGDFVRSILNVYRRECIAIAATSHAMASSLGIPFKEVVTPAPGGGWHHFEYELSEDANTAHISFTSGTTGEPKAVALSQMALSDVVRRLNASMEVDADIREYIGVPVNLSFGFGRCRAVSAAGGHCFIPEHGFNPVEINELAKGRLINSISAVPAQWRTLLKCPELIEEGAHQIRWIEIGSQHMSREEKLKMRALFPNAVILQHYGLTEASRSTFLRIDCCADDVIDSVGCATGEVELTVSPDSRIMIRGPHLALGEVKEGLIYPLTDNDGWLTTNDLGELREGFLYFKGRCDDLINCGGVKIPAEAFETGLRQKLGHSTNFAVGPASDTMRGQVILIAAENELPISDDDLLEAAFAVAQEFNVPTRESIRVQRCDKLPTTQSGKVIRRELESASSKVSIDTPTVIRSPSNEPSDVKSNLQLVWAQSLGMDHVPLDRSFFELGGDSLTAVSAMLQMERHDIPSQITRRVFEGKTLQDIFDELDGTEADTKDSSSTLATKSNVINAVRGVLVLLVVGVHWLPGVWDRLPQAFASMDEYLHPLYRLGTPGFALVFGLGMGFFQLPLARDNPGRAAKVARRNAAILGGGMILLASAKAGAAWLSPLPDVQPSIPGAFYSVLLYYFIAVLATPLLLRPLVRSSHAVSICLLISGLAFLLGEIAKEVVPTAQGTGLVEVFRLMLIAKYNVFAMTGIVMLGTAVGIAYRADKSQAEGKDGGYLPLASAMILFGMLACHQTSGLAAWMKTNGREPWALVTYAGVIILLCWTFQKLFTATRLPKLITTLSQSLIVIGILALPVFVLHEIVIPIKDIALELGVPSKLALALPMVAFFAAIGYLYLRLNRLYFSGRADIA